MPFENFTTLEYLLSFPGMIAAVIMLTQFTKGMFDKVVNHATKYVVYAWSFILCVVSVVVNGDLSSTESILTTILVWFINSIIVWFSAMKAFETIRGDTIPDGVLHIDTSNPEKDTYRMDFERDLNDLKNRPNVFMKVQKDG